jgi:rhodanese-related sulfurtransferase
MTLLLLGLVLPAAAVLAAEPYKEASLDQVQAWVASGSAVVYDVNGDDLWTKGHVPGARHLKGKDWTRTLPPEKGTLLVFYCSNTR